MSAIILFFVLVLSSAAIVSGAERKPQVSVINESIVFSLSWPKNSELKDLDSVTFTIQNASTGPLEWIKIRIVYKNNRGVLLQTDTLDRNFGKEPLAPGDAKQITSYANLKGFSFGKSNGSVSIEVIDARFTPSDPTISDRPNNQAP